MSEGSDLDADSSCLMCREKESYVAEDERIVPSSLRCAARPRVHLCRAVSQLTTIICACAVPVLVTAIKSRKIFWSEARAGLGAGNVRRRKLELVPCAFELALRWLLAGEVAAAVSRLCPLTRMSHALVAERSMKTMRLEIKFSGVFLAAYVIRSSLGWCPCRPVPDTVRPRSVRSSMAGSFTGPHCQYWRRVLNRGCRTSMPLADWLCASKV